MTLLRLDEGKDIGRSESLNGFIRKLEAVYSLSFLSGIPWLEAVLPWRLGSAGFVCAGGAARPLAEAACAACRGNPAGFFPDLDNAGT